VPRLKRFSFEGLQLSIPTDWDPIVLDRAGDSGFVRIEDEQKTERLTIKWNKIRGRFDLDRNFRKLEKTFARELKRQRKNGSKTRWEAPATVPKATKALRNYTARTYTWEEGKTAGWGAMVYAPKSDRASILQIVGQGKQDRQLAGEVLASFVDPQPGDKWQWEMHGVRLELPNEWHLNAARYDPRGVFRLGLRDDKQQSLTLVRWSLANLLTQENGLKAFVEKAMEKETKRYGLFFEPLQFDGHEAVRFERARPRKWAAVLQRLLRPAQPYYLHGVIWRDTTRNRLLLLMLKGRDENGMAEVERMARTMPDFGRSAAT
jgi:hypothetical protein